MSGGGTPRPDTRISDAHAEISRQQWDDYQARFIPRENELIGMVANPTQQAEELARAEALTQTANQTSEGITLRDSARYGGMTPEQERAFKKRSRLRSAARIADTKNRMNSGFKERDLDLAGKLVGVGRGIASDATSNYGALSGMESNRNATNMANATAKRGQNMAMAGTVVATAAMIF